MTQAWAGGGDFNIGYYDIQGVWHDHTPEQYCTFHQNDPFCVPQQQVQMPMQTTAITGFQKNDLEDYLFIAKDYWWVGVIFLIGFITASIVAWRVFAKNKYVSELLQIWGWKK